jgi:hypothetical protein
MLDGGASGAQVNFGARPFTAPFVFPNGITCRNFAELARVCRDNPTVAVGVLRQGFLGSFLGSQGRADLAVAAKEAARCPDRERGLDDFLGKLPGDVLKPARLRVEPPEIDLGTVRVGEDRRLELRLRNDGERLVHGTALAEGGWLGLGDSNRASSKLFQFAREAAMVVHVRGSSLRAYPKPQTGTITFESNGGTVVVKVRVQVPVKPFPEGVLAGVTTPRQLAEKARAAAKEAAVLIQNGAVARWYESNGWKYPVRGPTAAGIGAVQQLFEALGLVTPPKVEISAAALDFEADPEQRIEHVLAVYTEERRAVVAHGTCNEPWLHVGRTIFNARTATIPLIVPSVPHEPGATLRCKVTVHANGNQRFVVPVSLTIRNTTASYEAEQVPEPYVPAVASVETEPAYAVAADAVTAPEYPAVAVAEVPVPDAVEAPLAPPVFYAERPRRWVRRAPLVVLAGSLLVAAVHDLVGRGGERLLDRQPRLAVQFHEGGANDPLREPTMRFGLVLPGDPKKGRLTRDPMGRTNNTCVRIDGSENLFGDGGQWDPRAEEMRGGQERGLRSSWLQTAKKVRFTQEVEIIAGAQSQLLDTCLVRYRIANEDAAPHRVGLRFLLNTFLGSRDGGPFLIPGEERLCDSRKSLAGAEVPDFLEALEREDLRNPGVVAHLGLRLGRKVEAPSRVTLGAWPDRELQETFGEKRAQHHNTGWDVPVLSMKLLESHNAAAVLYWDEKEMKPNEVREVGFTYGLGSLAAGDGRGDLALTEGGSFAPGGEWTLVAYVKNPVAGQTLTLELPEGLSPAAGSRAKQEVQARDDTGISPVTWRLKSAGHDGRYDVKVTSSTGVTQAQTIFIRNRRFFD